MAIDRDKLPAINPKNPRLFEVPYAVHSYVENGQALLITFYNRANASFEVNGRVLNAEQNVINVGRNYAPTQLGTADSYVIPMPNGFLISLLIRVSAGNVLYGQTFITVQLVNGLTTTSLPLESLVASYITNGALISYPVTETQLPTQGRGAFVVSSIPVNAPGQASTATQFDVGSLVRFIGAYCGFTADANVANRYIYAQWSSNLGMVPPYALLSSQSNAITQNETVNINVQSHGIPYDYTTAGVRQIGLVLAESWSVSNLTAGITGQFSLIVVSPQAGDQLTGGMILTEQWVNA